MKRTLWICSVLACVLLLAMAAIAQVAQEKKICTTQASTQNQFSYQKMVQSQTLTQQMAQNQYTYQNKNQNKISNQKMTQSGGGNGNGGNQGQQGSRSGNGGSGNG